jgi:hypothetical protein
MKATMMLCDAVQAVEGKLYVLGGGWSVTGPGPAPSGLAILIEVPWDQANQKIDVALELLTEDGVPVTEPDPTGSAPVRVDGQIEVGRPPGMAPGTPLMVPMAVNIGPLPLTPGARYYWQLAIGNETNTDWRLPFAVRAPAPSGSFGATDFGMPSI